MKCKYMCCDDSICSVCKASGAKSLSDCDCPHVDKLKFCFELWFSDNGSNKFRSLSLRMCPPSLGSYFEFHMSTGGMLSALSLRKLCIEMDWYDKRVEELGCICNFIDHKQLIDEYESLSIYKG